MQKNPVYAIFSALLIILAALFPYYVKDYPEFINWKTIITIAGLIVITTGIEHSAMLDSLTIKMIHRSKNELGLALRFIVLSIIFSAFLTNDVSLFILIPITLQVQKYIKNDVGKLIVFEAIGVNVGSALTPIGNPQNIYIFHKWNLNSIEFVLKMMPMFLILSIILLLFVLVSFKRKPLSYVEGGTKQRKKNFPLFWVSIIFIVFYFVFLNSVLAIYLMFIAILIVYFITARSVLLKSDWSLIVLFCIMFIDFNVIAKIPTVHNFITSTDLSNPKNLFGVSVLLSQIISNVPASIFLSKYSTNYRIISYGVNVGGNGFIIGSLANIIALRLSKKNLFLEFHKYSLMFLFITFILVVLLLL